MKLDSEVLFYPLDNIGGNLRTLSLVSFLLDFQNRRI